MIRSQKAPGRYVHNQPLSDTNPASANAGDITSYIGKILNINYHQVVVEDVLGQGGFAFVFLVRAFNQQRYALKRMYVNNQRDLLVCQREIALTKEFATHPNIIKYVDSSIQRTASTNLQRRPYYPDGNEDGVDNEDDAIYEILLLTEYCANGALTTRLNEQRNIGLTLNERQILRIFADICHAVSACHFRRPQPILHRDIKLENILINSQQSYVLCDFGSSILLPPSPTNDYQQYPVNQLTTNIIQQLEEEVQRYTTLSYRAPEMVDLYSRIPITLKADIWAMGCLLYKLMYNTMPFGDSILAIQNGTFTIPDDMTQTYSRELNLLVRYILEIDINKRPDIWQISYVTYKFLGSECPIPNRCQSTAPDLRTVSMPLTDSESRYQRTNALSKSKSQSSNVTDDSLSLGTAVNPRERPRGMMAPSTSLINFSQASQQPPPLAVPPLLPVSNPARAGSTAQLMFDDDFSKIPSHAISLTNIPTSTASTANEQAISRVRPSPPATVSTASGFALHQQLLPPPPATSSSSAQMHRRSSSQTISPTNAQSAFPSASSADISPRDEASDDDNDAHHSGANAHNIKVQNHSDFYLDDDQLISPDNRNIKPKSMHHRPSTEEAEKSIFFSSLNQRTSVQSSHEYTSTRQDQPNPSKHHSGKDHSVNDSINNGFDQLINDDSDTEPDQRTETSQHSAVSNEYNNPFLHAPFHRSPANKQASAPNPVTSTAFDAEGIMTGKKTSAFARYQKQDIRSDNLVTDTTSTPGISIVKVAHLGSSAAEKPSPSANVFTNAPFKTKPKNKQHSTATNNLDSTTSITDEDNPRTNPLADTSPERQGYSNLSFNAGIIDDYF